MVLEKENEDTVVLPWWFVNDSKHNVRKS